MEEEVEAEAEAEAEAEVEVEVNAEVLGSGRPGRRAVRSGSEYFISEGNAIGCVSKQGLKRYL